MRQDNNSASPSQGASPEDVLAIISRKAATTTTKLAGSSAKASADAAAASKSSVPAAPKQAKGPQSFSDFRVLGYDRTVPIIPPDAEISENSSLLKRKDARGKAVGVRGFGGKWFGFDWLPHEATDEDAERWQAMGAGVGIKTGRDLILIDADTLDEGNAKVIRDIVEKHCGQLPARVGRYPKVGYPVRVTEPVQYSRVEFGELDERGSLTSRVEILSEGRQFVAHGIHPVTREPYFWPRPLVAKDKLPQITPAQLQAMMTELQSVLPAAKPIITEGSTTKINQAALKGNLALVRKAVEAIPNTSQHFGTRESYRDFGYAIKAALPDNPDEAFEIFSEWCERWKDGDNAADTVKADWSRMKPPYRRGAGWLFELAEQHAPEKFSRSEQWFEEPQAYESLFGPEAGKASAPTVEIQHMDLRALSGKKPPKRRWVLDSVIPDGEVSLLTGRGGVGKTLLAQQMATAIAKGLPFLGRQVDQRKVMLFLCEDSEDELHVRQDDINRSMGLTMEDIADDMLICSRKFMDNLLSVHDRSTGAMRRTAVWEGLVEKAKAFGAKFIVVDTIADTFGGSEIDRTQVRQFVQACLGRLAQEIGGAVLALGHPSRSGESSGEGTSGSTAWHASVRSRLYLDHAAKDQSGPFRKLSNKKANYGPQGAQWLLRWARGVLEFHAGSVSEAVAAAHGAAALPKSVGDAAQDAVIAVIRNNSSKPLNLKRNSPHYAPKALKVLDPDTLAPFNSDEIRTAIDELERRGAIRADKVDRDASYRPVMGYVVIPDKLSGSPDTTGSLFG